MAEIEAGQNRTERVFEALRFELLESRLQPGERLKLVELAERFGISQTVVREALTRLSEQGLVVATPNKGFMVSGAGTMAIRTPKSSADVSITVLAGVVYPIALQYLRIAGTSATGIVGFN